MSFQVKYLLALLVAGLIVVWLRRRRLNKAVAKGLAEIWCANFLNDVRFNRHSLDPMIPISYYLAARRYFVDHGYEIKVKFAKNNYRTFLSVRTKFGFVNIRIVPNKEYLKETGLNG